MLSRFKRRAGAFLQYHSMVGSQAESIRAELHRQGEALDSIAATLERMATDMVRRQGDALAGIAAEIVAPKAQPQSDPWASARRHSYSIEGEDLLIERALTALVGLPREYVGHYLDIGAFHPVWDSNTYAFYERGWQGICVEPNPEHHGGFSEIRPRDRIFKFGLAAKAKTLRYHKFANSGLNGFYDQELVDKHVENGQEYLGYQDFECMGIREFLSKHVTTEIDFMDLDVETLEVELLRAWDWTVCRPKVICAEIHSFDIKEMLGSEVGTILQEAGYSAMARGWQSSIFVANECLARFMRTRDSRAVREIAIGEAG